MDISFSYRSIYPSLPDVNTQLGQLWQAAVILDGIGIPLTDWYPTAENPDDALRNCAFDSNGPSPAAVAIAKENDRHNDDKDMRSMAVWNGKRRAGSAGISNILFPADSPASCTFEISSTGVAPLLDKANVIQVATKLLDLYPAPFISVSESRYDAIHKVFKDRPGVGWMLYLPRKITTSDVPEAQELIAVTDKNGEQRGTFVVSIKDEPFSVKNEEHIKIATAIEIRLVDKDMLPRYGE